MAFDDVGGRHEVLVLREHGQHHQILFPMPTYRTVIPEIIHGGAMLPIA